MTKKTENEARRLRQQLLADQAASMQRIAQHMELLLTCVDELKSRAGSAADFAAWDKAMRDLREAMKEMQQAINIH